jgi:hypothetical protein
MRHDALIVGQRVACPACDDGFLARITDGLGLALDASAYVLPLESSAAATAVQKGRTTELPANRGRPLDRRAQLDFIVCSAMGQNPTMRAVSRGLRVDVAVFWTI